MTPDEKKTEGNARRVEQADDSAANAHMPAGPASSRLSGRSHSHDTAPMLYRDDPNFRGLLQDFQNADWEKCQQKIGQLLVMYPEDGYLLSFKQDVEIRLALQETRKKHQDEDLLHRRRWFRWSAPVIGGLTLVVTIAILWASHAYQVQLAQAKLAQEASAAAQALAAKYQTADTLMQAGKPADALPLYLEIQQSDPSYQDIGQAIQLARQSIAVEDLYQQGTQALKDGKSDTALGLLLQIEQLHPKYKDTPQLIAGIQREQQIASLLTDIHSAYAANNWPLVVSDYEAIQALDPFRQVPEVNEELFVSYQRLITDIAGRTNLTLADIDTADRYYRSALALFPQDAGHAQQRDDLKNLAAGLLISRYYLQGIALLETSNYSMQGLQAAIIAMRQTGVSGTNPPAAQAAIQRAQWFLDGYNNLLQRKWDPAITSLENLYSKDGSYAGGRVTYFLYEAYTARGDLLFANADFRGALKDYQSADRYAWSNGGNLLRLLQIEARLGLTLHKIGQLKNSAVFYQAAFDRLGYQKRLSAPAQQDLLNTLTQANAAFKAGHALEAIGLYETAMKQADQLYEQTKVAVSRDDTLPNVAFENNSSLESLRAANQLGESLVIGQDRDMLIPGMPPIGP